jgi:hypothetical protein
MDDLLFARFQMAVSLDFLAHGRGSKWQCVSPWHAMSDTPMPRQ